MLNVDLNFTPAALFPDNQTASTDPKCVVIAEVIQQISGRLSGPAVQEKLVKDAQSRYQFLSEQENLELWEAQDAAFVLGKKGVTQDVAIKYLSFRLSEEDARNWKDPQNKVVNIL